MQEFSSYKQAFNDIQSKGNLIVNQKQKEHMKNLNNIKIHILNYIKAQQKSVWKKICKILIPLLASHIQQTHTDMNFFYKNQDNEQITKVIALSLQQILAIMQSNKEYSTAKHVQNLINQSFINKRLDYESKVFEYCITNQKEATKERRIRFQYKNTWQNSVNKYHIDNTQIKKLEQQVRAYQRTFQAMLIDHSNQRNVVNQLKNYNISLQLLIAQNQQKNGILIKLLNQQATLYLDDQNILKQQIKTRNSHLKQIEQYYQSKLIHISQLKHEKQRQIAKSQKMFKQKEELHSTQVKQLLLQLQELTKQNLNLIMSQKDHCFKFKEQNKKKDGQINVLLNKIAKLQQLMSKSQNKQEENILKDRIFMLQELNKLTKANKKLSDENKRIRDKIQKMGAWLQVQQIMNNKVEQQKQCLSMINMQLASRNRQLIQLSNKLERQLSDKMEKSVQNSQNCLQCRQKQVKLHILSRLVDQIELSSKQDSYGQRIRNKQISLDQSLLDQLQMQSLSRINQSIIESFNKQNVTLPTEYNE